MARLARADEVRARMASLLHKAGTATAVRVGAFTLRPAQARALVPILGAVRRFGGVLIADPPGTGKTVLALAAAAALRPQAHVPDADEVLVIGPAALGAQWLDASRRAEVRIAFHSMEALSRGRRPASARTVIVDEAHHARTPGTRRYARLAACCVDAQVLLLSATPVVNRAADRDALLALFLGARASALTASEQARCIIRSGAGTADGLRPAVRRIGVLGAAHDVPGLDLMLAALPPPLPVAEGAHATALVRLSLALAWRSSLAALDAALARRLQRGAAMHDLLASGRVPSRAMLRHWTLHDGATQLALGALLDAPGRATERAPEASAARDRMRAELDAHLDAVTALRDRIRPHRDADTAARAASIGAIARAHPDRRIVVFARHARTVHALHAALRDRPGVVSIVGARVRAASGRWSRDEVLRAVGPRARPLRSDDPRAIRILLATDVVAEGVEMQGVGIVVHADLPWTPARLEQRLGRVVRVGSPHREVLEAHLPAPRGARRALRLGARLLRKSTVRDAAVREPRAQAAIDARLARWGSTMPCPTADAALGGATVAVHSRIDGFLAIAGEPPRWIAGIVAGGRWRLSSAPRFIARIMRHAEGAEVPRPRQAFARCARVIARALRLRHARALVATTDALDDADVGARTSMSDDASQRGTAASRRLARVRARLARLLAGAPALARAGLAAGQARLLARLAGPLEVARERQLDALLRADLDDATFARRLGALLGPRRTDEPSGQDERRPGAPGRLHALLLLSAGPSSPPPTAP